MDTYCDYRVKNKNSSLNNEKTANNPPESEKPSNKSKPCEFEIPVFHYPHFPDDWDLTTCIHSLKTTLDPIHEKFRESMIEIKHHCPSFYFNLTHESNFKLKFDTSHKIFMDSIKNIPLTLNFWKIERFCAYFFVLEFVATLFSTPVRRDYLFDIFGIADYCGIIPYFLIVNNHLFCSRGWFCVVDNRPDGDGLIKEPVFPRWILPVGFNLVFRQGFR